MNFTVDYIGIGNREYTQKGAARGNQFAWSVGTGVTYDINERIALDFGYRFLDTGKAKAGTCWYAYPVGSIALVEADMSAKTRYHDMHVGIRYSF